MILRDSVLLVAEMSANHLGSLARAMEIVESAATHGADAIKIQLYDADAMTLDCDRTEYVIRSGPWAGRRMHELYSESGTPYEWAEPLLSFARQHGLATIASVFDQRGIDAACDAGVDALKIASFELCDPELVARAAAPGLPLIMSTGVASSIEITSAVNASERASERVLLHCVSAYPARVEDMQISCMTDLAEQYGLPVGLSDHSTGHAAAVVAVACGARMVEKHYTLARSDGGPDAEFSMEPAEWRGLVGAVHETVAAIGNGGQSDRASQFRRSLVAVASVPMGATLERRHLRALRPGAGLAPWLMSTVVGRRLARALEPGEPLRWDHLEGT